MLRRLFGQCSTRLLSHPQGRCLYSTQSTIPPSISEWIADLTSRPPSTTTDTVSLERATQLHRTLPTRQAPPSSMEWPGLGHSPPATGQPLPKAFHLAYFQPQSWLKDLGKDGTSTEYNAPAPYLRRMWAGGSFTWSPSVSLSLGEEVTESVSVSRAEFKKGMIFVHQQRLLYPGLQIPAATTGSEGWAVKEVRTHVFREPINTQIPTPAGSPAPQRSPSPSPTPTYTFTFTPSAPLLFRYSALTWNAHRIHYDREWTQRVEGHPDLVFHGPLSATLLVELAERIALDHGKALIVFTYRATSPMYVDLPITLSALPTDRENIWELQAEQSGRQGMKACATLA